MRNFRARYNRRPITQGNVQMASLAPTAEHLGARFPALAAHLVPDELELFAHVLTPVRLLAGEELLQQGARHPQLFFLWDGAFALQYGDEQSAAELGSLPPNSAVGEVSFFDGGPVAATVRVVSRVGVALGIDEETFEAFAEEHPKAAAGVYRALATMLAERLRAATERFEEVMPAARTTDARVLDRHRAIDLLRRLFGAREAK